MHMSFTFINHHLHAGEFHLLSKTSPVAITDQSITLILFRDALDWTTACEMAWGKSSDFLTRIAFAVVMTKFTRRKRGKIFFCILCVLFTVKDFPNPKPSAKQTHWICWSQFHHLRATEWTVGQTGAKHQLQGSFGSRGFNPNLNAS
jgi:hypothetical protein